jgi:hypothetical protein
MAKKSIRPEDDMIKAIAALRVKRMAEDSKIGKMLDKLELNQAPRQKFLTKGTGAPAPKPSSSKKATPAKKSIIPTSPTR